mgnify:CR=1 FL=1
MGMRMVVKMMRLSGGGLSDQGDLEEFKVAPDGVQDVLEAEACYSEYCESIVQYY